MVPLRELTTVHGAFAAHVLAARLRSDGFDVVLRGSLGGPYAVTVGDLARVEVLVPADQIPEARLSLLEGEVEEALDADPRPVPERGAPWGLRLVVVIVVAAALWPIVRLVVGG